VILDDVLYVASGRYYSNELWALDLGGVEKPVITDMERGSITITWDSQAGATYRVESSTSPYDYNEALMAWANEATGIASGGAETSWVDVAAPTPAPAEKYYRVYTEDDGGDLVADDTVGLQVLTANNGRNLVSSAFEPYPDGGGTPGESTLDKIIGNQLTGHPFNPGFSDNIEKWDNSIGNYMRSWYNTSTSTWQGAFPFKADEGYWFNIVLTHPNTDVTLFGRVSPTDRQISVNVSANSIRNLLGTCFPKASSLSTSGLVASGFTGHAFNPGFSDHVEFWDGSNYNRYWYNTSTSTWQPSDRAMNPGDGFWINVNMGRPGFTWDYPKP